MCDWVGPGRGKVGNVAMKMNALSTAGWNRGIEADQR